MDVTSFVGMFSFSKVAYLDGYDYVRSSYLNRTVPWDMLFLEFCASSSGTYHLVVF